MDLMAVCKIHWGTITKITTEYLYRAKALFLYVFLVTILGTEFFLF